MGGAHSRVSAEPLTMPLMDDFQFLDAYYDASQKAQNAALEVQRHAGLSITELKTLKAVARHLQSGTERGFQLALRGLNEMTVENLDLPYLLLEMLEAAKVGYAEVIRICDNEVKDVKQKTEEGIWNAVGACCATVLSVAVCSMVPLRPQLAGAIGTVMAAVGAMTMAHSAAGSVRLNQLIHKINNLQKKIKEQQELLQRAAQKGNVMTTAIKPLKVKLRHRQEKLQAEPAAGTSPAKLCVEDMEDIIRDESLETLLQELQSLSGTCGQLCDMLNSTYELFKEKPGFITHRVLRGENLY